VTFCAWAGGWLVVSGAGCDTGAGAVCIAGALTVPVAAGGALLGGAADSDWAHIRLAKLHHASKTQHRILLVNDSSIRNPATQQPTV